MIAARVGVALSGEECVFGGDYEVVPIGFQEFAEEALAAASLYLLAVSMKLPSAPAKPSKIFRDSSFDVARPKSFQASPNVIVPRQSLGNPEPAFS
jgi:hypothetical protein